MSRIKLDLSQFKHIKSDKNATTLQHKAGHILTLANNALGPEAQEQLKALSSVSKPDQTPKHSSANKNDSIKKMAIGGDVEEDQTTTTPAATDKPAPKPIDVPANAGGASTWGQAWNNVKKGLTQPGMAEGGQVKKMAAGGSADSNAPYDAGLPCLNPHCKSHGKPHPNCRCYSMAEGGQVSKLRYCAKGSKHLPDCEYAKDEGISEQGKDIRHANKPGMSQDDKDMSMDFARQEASGRAKFEREAIKPKLKGLAHGGATEKDDNVPDSDEVADLDMAAPSDSNTTSPPQDDNGPKPGLNQQPIDDKDLDTETDAADPAKQNVAKPPTSADFERVSNQLAMPQDSDLNSQLTPTNTETPAERFERSKQQAIANHKQQLIDENTKFEQDLANGHITPKTYQSLFHDKGTLGKIGSLFGLLVSGVGSGLTHQPNAVLNMMDQEIQRDLQAQIQSKTNAQNFLKVNQQALMNSANVRETDTDINTKAYALAQANMLQSSYKDLANSIDTMPEGPGKEVAKQKLAMVYQAVNAKINNINDLSTGAQAYYNTMFPRVPGAQPGGKNIAKDPSDTTWAENAARMAIAQGNGPLAQQWKERIVPGVGVAPEGVVVPENVRQKLTAHKNFDTMAKRYADFAKQNAANWHNLNIPERQKVINEGKSMGAELQSVLGNTLETGQSLGAHENLENILPSDPTKAFNSITVLPKIKGLIDSNQSRFNTLKQAYKLPVTPNTSSDQKTAAKAGVLREGATGTEKGTGKPIVFKNGTWSYK